MKNETDTETEKTILSYFEKTQNNDLFISPKRKNATFLLLKNHLLYPNLTTRCQKVEKIVRQTNLKLLVNLTS